MSLQKEAARGGKEKDDSDGIDRRNKPERRLITDVFRNQPADKHAQSEPQVPRGEDAAVGGAALVVMRHRHKHVEESRVHVPVSQPDEDGGKVIGPWMRTGDKKHIARQRNAYPHRAILREPAFAQGLAPLQAGDDQTDGEEHEIGARPAGDAQFIATVDGEEVAERAETRAEEGDVDGQEPRPREEKAVEGDFALVGHHLARLQFHQMRAQDRNGGKAEGDPKKRRETVGEMIDIDAQRGRQRHRDVGAQAIKPDALLATTGRQHVDGDRAVGHGHRAEGNPVQRSHNGEKQQRSRRHIAKEEYAENTDTQHQDLLTGEAVHHIPAERTREQRRQRVTAEHHPNRVLPCPEFRVQIERQQWHQKIEREIEKRIRHHHEAVIPIPKTVHF